MKKPLDTPENQILSEEQIARVQGLIKIGREADEEAAEIAISGNLASNKIYHRYKELRARSTQTWNEIEKEVKQLPEEL